MAQQWPRYKQFWSNITGAFISKNGSHQLLRSDEVIVAWSWPIISSFEALIATYLLYKKSES